MPDFRWTGSLRPDKVTPYRPVDEAIPRPDYWVTGYPVSEMESRQQQLVPQRSEKEIEGLRKVCRLAREVLDIAHAAIRPGITTDELDEIVHKACMERGTSHVYIYLWLFACFHEHSF